MRENNNTLERDTMIDAPYVSTEQLIENFKKAVEDCIEIPNSWLPEAYHDKVRGGRTITRMNELLDKKEGLTDHVKLKALKARNIAKMAAQVADIETAEMDFPLDYSENEVDEIAQHRAECALVGGMISGGLIDADDLLED
jgi:hypothetical protein